LNLIRENTFFDVVDGSVFAFDLGRETADASRSKWRTDVNRDGRFTGIRAFPNRDYLWVLREDYAAVFVDRSTGKVLNEFPTLWPSSGPGSAITDGDRLYRFTSDGMAYAMQLKAAKK
jgi:hypothetical protein